MKREDKAVPKEMLDHLRGEQAAFGFFDAQMCDAAGVARSVLNRMRVKGNGMTIATMNAFLGVLGCKLGIVKVRDANIRDAKSKAFAAKTDKLVEHIEEALPESRYRDMAAMKIREAKFWFDFAMLDKK